MCGHDRRVFAALELTADLPPPEQMATCLARWLGEPVKTIFIPTRVFVSNRTGYPVLPRELQDIVKAFFRFKIHVVVKGVPLHDPPDAKVGLDGLGLYLMYIRHLHELARGEMRHGEQWHMAYNDYLQAPLQPLMDNLESQVSLQSLAVATLGQNCSV